MKEGEFEKQLEHEIFPPNIKRQVWKIVEEAKKEFGELTVRLMIWNNEKYVCIDKKELDGWFLKWFGGE